MPHVDDGEPTASTGCTAKDCNVNRRLLPMKLHYLLYFAGTAPIVAYMAVYARQLGFSSVQVGWMYTALQLASLVVKPVFGLIADKFRLRKALIIALVACTVIAYFNIHFIEPIPPTLTFDRSCGSVTDVLEFCPDVEPRNECFLKQVDGQRFGDRLQMQCWLECERQTAASSLSVDLGHIEQVGDCLQFTVLHNSSSPTQCLGYPMFNCSGTCSDANIAHVLAANREQNGGAESEPIPPQLIYFVACMLVGGCAWTVLESMNAAVSFSLLGADQQHRFGEQRLWASVGWGLSSLSTGFLIDAMSGGRVMNDYSGLFYLMLALLVCDFVAAFTIENVQCRQKAASMWSHIGRMLRSGRNVVFFVWCIVAGIQTAAIWNFLFWYLEELSEAMGTTACEDRMNLKSLQGLVSAVQTFGGEIPCLFLSGWLLKRIGHAHAMSLVLGAFGVRFLCYSLLVHPWWVLPVELLQGITFAIFFATMSSYASVMAAPDAQATLQGVAGAIFEGIGVSTGNVLCGYMLEHLGGAMMFRWFSYVSFAMCAGHVVIQLLYDRLAQVRPELGSEDFVDVRKNILDANRTEIVKDPQNGKASDSAF